MQISDITKVGNTEMLRIANVVENEVSAQRASARPLTKGLLFLIEVRPRAHGERCGNAYVGTGHARLFTLRCSVRKNPSNTVLPKI